MDHNLETNLLRGISSTKSAQQSWLGILWCVIVLAALTGIHLYNLCNININKDISGDISLYHRVINSIWAGKMPYRDFTFEYPPYVLLWFILPGCFDSPQTFQFVFGLEIILADLAMKVGLIWLAFQHPSKRLWVIPVLLFSMATAANYDFYLQRFDLIPAAISVVMLVTFSRKRCFLAGGLAALGIGCKLYPILFVPPLFLIAYQQKQLRAFGLGLLLGMLPSFLLGYFMPWWQFLTFHAQRGLQAESLYASLLWFASEFGLVDAKWIWVKAWFEVESPLNSYFVPAAQGLFLGVTFYAELFVCWRAWRLPHQNLASLARLLLIPLTAFIAFNLVLSPQYLLWTAGLAAIAALDGRLNGPLYLIIAAIMIPLFYPSPNYGIHLNMLETTSLLLRNLMLIAALISLVWELWPIKNIYPSPPPLTSPSK